MIIDIDEQDRQYTLCKSWLMPYIGSIFRVSPSGTKQPFKVRGLTSASGTEQPFVKVVLTSQ